jgi:hypothetical protein
MAILLDTERLLNQLKKGETLIKRLGQNQAYQAHQATIRELKKLVDDQTPTVESNLAERKLLEIEDPAQRIFREDWRRLNLEASRLQRAFENDIQEPLNQLLEEVQGSAATVRWGLSLEPKSHPLPPVVEVRDPGPCWLALAITVRRGCLLFQRPAQTPKGFTSSC